MAKTVETEIEIEASAAIVWEVLADFDRIAEWNDFIRRIEGENRVGSKLIVEVWLGDRKPMTFRPRLLAYERGRELRWIGRFIIPGLADGKHSFVIEPLGYNRVRFVQRETFSGLLIPLIWRSMAPDLEACFRAMNRALKARVESQATASA